MSLPPRSSSRVLVIGVLVLVATVIASGCTAPGAGRLTNRAPKDLPKALRFVPGDSMGWMLLDADANSKRWQAIEAATGEATGAAETNALWERVFGDEVDPGLEVAPWVGSHAGIALQGVELDEPDSLLVFAEVRARSELVKSLEGAGWRTAKRQLPEGDAADELTLYEPSGAGTSRGFEAVGVADDAMVAAPTRQGLIDMLERADEYSANERKATNDYTVLAMQRTPLAVVFRNDVIRDQLRRLVQDDPALLEMSGWAVRIPFVSAMRDGWIGIAPPLDAKAEGDIRIIGNFDWLKDIGDPVKPKPVVAGVLDDLPPDTTTAIAIHNPGQFAESVLNAVTAGGSDFANKLDKERSKTQVKLFDILEDLDGAAAIGWTERGFAEARVAVDDAEDLTDRVEASAADVDLAGIEGESDGAHVVVRVQNPPTDDVNNVNISGAPAPRRAADLVAVGKPPRQPIMWLWKRNGRTCLPEATQPIAKPAPGAGPIAAWLTWDGTIRMTFTAAMPLDAILCVDDVRPDSAQHQTFQSLILGD